MHEKIRNVILGLIAFAMVALLTITFWMLYLYPSADRWAW